MASSILHQRSINTTSNLRFDDFDDMPSRTLGWVNQPIANSPNGAATFAGHVFTYKPFATHGFQIALRHNGNDLFVRTMSDSVWGAWRRITITTV